MRATPFFTASGLAFASALVIAACAGVDTAGLGPPRGETPAQGEVSGEAGAPGAGSGGGSGSASGGSGGGGASPDDASADDAASADDGAAGDASPDAGDTSADAAPDGALPDGGDGGGPLEPCARPETHESRLCGRCGTQSRVCKLVEGQARWLPWGDCVDERGACYPGTVVNEPCGRCGVRPRVCTADCRVEVGVCTDRPGASAEVACARRGRAGGVPSPRRV